jgi:hypothetical protein
MYNMVKEVLDQWDGPSDTYFKVRADDGNLYALRRETSAPTNCGIWNRFGNSQAAILGRLT